MLCAASGRAKQRARRQREREREMASRALSHYRAAPSKQQLHHNNNVGTARRRCSQLSGTRRNAAGCGLLVLANKASTRTTRIVLRQPVRGLGVQGDLCDVKPGYFRNYLGPFGFAKLATPDVLAEVQAKIDAEAKAKEKVKQQAEQVRRQTPPQGRVDTNPTGRKTPIQH